MIKIEDMRQRFAKIKAKLNNNNNDELKLNIIEYGEKID